LPIDFDTVIPIEDVTLLDENANPVKINPKMIRIVNKPVEKQFVREKASDIKKG
jgi:hypothetical protein